MHDEYAPVLLSARTGQPGDEQYGASGRLLLEYAVRDEHGR